MKVLNINPEYFVSIGLQNILEKHFNTSEIIWSCELNEIEKLLKEISFDIILLDIGMISINIHDLMKLLTTRQKTAEILIFSDAKHKPHVLEYISMGASGFLDKSSSEEDLIQAINLIKTGHLYITKDLLMSKSSAYDIDNNTLPLDRLSKRELEVFKLLIKGKRIKDISQIMQIHQPTVSTLKRRILEKFNVDNLMKLKSRAMEYGY